MKPLHSLLRRQLKRHGIGSLEELPVKWLALLGDVDEAYHQSDDDRSTLERALDLSSQELLEANSDMRAIFQALPDLFFRLDAENRIVDIKGGSSSDFFLPPRELLQKRLQDLPDRNVAARLGEALTQVKARRTLVAIEYQLVLGGRTEIFEARLLPVLSDNTIVIIRNITSRRATENELYQSRLMLQLILDNIPQRVFWKDREHRYLGCNLPFSRDAGLAAPVEIFGRDDFDLAWRDDATRLRAQDEQVMSSGTPLLSSEEPVERDGRRTWLRMSKVPLHDREGRVFGVLGSYEDVTEKKLAEEQLRQAAKMEAIGRLAGGIAHDFNNFLAGIGCYVEVLLEPLQEDDPMAVDLREIERAIKRASSLTAQLLAFSRKQVITPKRVDLNVLVPHAGLMLRRMIGEDIELKLEPGTEPAQTLADPGQIEQVLINLAVNARDAMPRGGQLVVRTERRTVSPGAFAHGEEIPAGEYAVLSVSDSGVGLDPEARLHLFEPFFTTKEKGRGTGLGLSTIYGIVKQNGGLIAVESEANEGTTFTIYLPAVGGEPEPLPGTRTFAPARGTETILLVEDDEMVRRLARQILARQGYQLVEAASGRQALLEYERLGRRVDLLVTDVVMPHMNGRELHEQLLRIQPGLPVLYMSGHAEDVIAHHGFLDHGMCFLAKPFTGQELTQKVREVLDHGSTPSPGVPTP